MFVDMFSGPTSDWELVAEHSKLVSEPPDGLLACVVVPDGHDQVRGITVWESPGRRSEWAASVMMPLFQSGVLAGVQSNPEDRVPSAGLPWRMTVIARRGCRRVPPEVR